MTNFKTWLSLLSITPLILLLWLHQPALCQKTLSYRIGHFDHQFGLQQSEFLSLIKQAESIWEAAADANLFTYDPEADFTINLIYDGRQRTTVDRRTIVHNLRKIETSHTNLATSFEHRRKIFEEKNAAYQQALADYQVHMKRYNDNLRYWNSKKGTVDTFHKLIQARQQLLIKKAGMDKDRLYLISLLETLQSIQAQGETIEGTYQTKRQIYQAYLVKPNSFNQGEYDGKSITLYQFNDSTDLIALLTHELGHALGLPHVDDPEAVMYYSNVRLYQTTPALTRNDIEALKNACHLG